MVTDNALDEALDYIATGVYVALCSQEPASYANVATYKLADIAVTAGAGNGDWTIANGDTSGRKLTLAEQTGETVDTDGTATHLAVTDGSGELLATVALSDPQALTAGNPFTISAVDILEIRDPS